MYIERDGFKIRPFTEATYHFFRRIAIRRSWGDYNIRHPLAPDETVAPPKPPVVEKHWNPGSIRVGMEPLLAYRRGHPSSPHLILPLSRADFTTFSCTQEKVTFVAAFRPNAHALHGIALSDRSGLRDRPSPILRRRYSSPTTGCAG